MLITTPAVSRHSKLNPILDNSEGRYLVGALRSFINYYVGARSSTPSEDANFEETPWRAALAWVEVHKLSLAGGMAPTVTGLIEDLKAQVKPHAEMIAACTEVLSTGFPMEDPLQDSGIITQGPILVSGLCPHHLLPVTLEVFVAYKPRLGGNVLGLSKLARLALLLGSRPVLQEQVTADIVDCLHFNPAHGHPYLPQIESAGAAAQVVGHHQCMACRGVRSDALTHTAAIRGIFHHDSQKAEFYRAVDAIRTSDLQMSIKLKDVDPLNPWAKEEPAVYTGGG